MLLCERKNYGFVVEVLFCNENIFLRNKIFVFLDSMEVEALIVW